MKKKILLVILAIIFIAINPVFAARKGAKTVEQLDEVVLETPEEQTDSIEVPQSVSITEQRAPEEKTLKEKLQDVYHLEVEKYDKPTYLLEDVFTHKFDENSIMDRTQLWAGYNGDIGLQFNQDGLSHEHTTNHYDINTINVGYDGFLKNNNADFRVMINIAPFSSRNVIQNLFADMYVATNKIPHHRLLVGHSRPPVGLEGAYGPFVLPFIARSQISRNFGTVRKLGARASVTVLLIMILVFTALILIFRNFSRGLNSSAELI